MLNELAEYNEYTCDLKNPGNKAEGRLLKKYIVGEGDGFGGVVRALRIIARKLLFEVFDYENSKDRAKVREAVKLLLNSYLGFNEGTLSSEAKELLGLSEENLKELGLEGWFKSYCKGDIFDEWVRKSKLKNSESAVDWGRLTSLKKYEWNKPLMELTKDRVKFNQTNFENIIAEAIEKGRLNEYYLAMDKSLFDKGVERCYYTVTKNKGGGEKSVNYYSFSERHNQNATSNKVDIEDRFLKWLAAFLVSRGHTHRNERCAAVSKVDVANWMGSATFANSQGAKEEMFIQDSVICGNLADVVDGRPIIWSTNEENNGVSKTYVDGEFLSTYDVRIITREEYEKELDLEGNLKYRGDKSRYAVYADCGSGRCLKLL